MQIIMSESANPIKRFANIYFIMQSSQNILMIYLTILIEKNLISKIIDII